MKMTMKEVGPIETNCYIVWDEKSMEGIVFDPGAEADVLYDIINSEQIIVKYILLTHTHYDHTGGVKALYDILKEKPIIGVHPKEYEAMMKDDRQVVADKSFEVQLYLESIPVEIATMRFDLIIVPGHTVASVCFYCEEEHILIAGDTLFYHTIGTNRTYDGPSMDLVHNITDLLLNLPDETRVFPGHGPSTTILEERTKNPYLSNSDTIDPWL
jgi:glyoxylase-like metal-dependent hydrolase (beta-lactamase superfamily II)